MEGGEEEKDNQVRWQFSGEETSVCCQQLTLLSGGWVCQAVKRIWVGHQWYSLQSNLSLLRQLHSIPRQPLQDSGQLQFLGKLTSISLVGQATIPATTIGPKIKSCPSTSASTIRISFPPLSLECKRELCDKATWIWKFILLCYF